MSKLQNKRVAIVGGGISGLASAYFLEQAGAGLDIHLFESNEQLGGKIQTRHMDGMTLELGAESFLSRKQHGIALCEQLDLADQLRGTNLDNKRTFVWHHDRLHPLPEGLSGFVPSNLGSLRSTTLLNLSGKLRVGLDYLIPARKGDADESLASFISRRLGRQAYQRLVQPLLCGIYCADGKDLSLNATFPELKKLVQTHGSLIRGLGSRTKKGSSSKYAPFVTLPGGMSDLIRTVHSALETTRVSLGKPIQSASFKNGTQLDFQDGDQQNFDAVIFATSSAITAQMLDGHHHQLKASLNGIPHVSTATVNLWYDADNFDAELNGYGFVIPSDQQNGITAVTWTSSKHFDRAPRSKRLIRAYVGRAERELSDETTDAEIMEIVDRELRRTMNLTSQSLGSLITRWPGGSPQYNLGHLDRLKAIDEQLAQLPGAFVCGSSYRGVGIPDCIREAEKAAQQTIDYLKKRV